MVGAVAILQVCSPMPAKNNIENNIEPKAEATETQGEKLAKQRRFNKWFEIAAYPFSAVISGVYGYYHILQASLDRFRRHGLFKTRKPPQIRNG